MRRRHLAMVAIGFVFAACERPHFPQAPTATVLSLTMTCRQAADRPKNTSYCTLVAQWSDGGPGEAVGGVGVVEPGCGHVPALS